MKAMVLHSPREPLRMEEIPVPGPGQGQVLLRVSVCGVCRTDLHITSGELTRPKLPLVLGHQVVGRIERTGPDARRFATGERVGVPWLGFVDESCRFCRRGLENLCEHARFTGYDIDGGYDEYLAVDERFCLPVPTAYHDLQAAPLLCAGLIRHRGPPFSGGGGRGGALRFGRAAPHLPPG